MVIFQSYDKLREGMSDKETVSLQATLLRSRGSGPTAIPSVCTGRVLDPKWQLIEITRSNQYLHVYYYITMYMGVSENSVPLNPMVNDHYPY